MAKVRMQWKAPTNAWQKMNEKERQAVHYKSAWDILAKVYAHEGLKGWYNVIGFSSSSSGNGCSNPQSCLVSSNYIYPQREIIIILHHAFYLFKWKRNDQTSFLRIKLTESFHNVL
jgi:hypothetical protein